MDFNKFLVSSSCTLKEAMNKIETNHQGYIFVETDDRRIIGLATDGDLRRALLNGATLDDNIVDFANSNYVKVTSDTPKEKILKLLDNQIKVIPVLDSNGRLLEMVSKTNLPSKNEEKVFYRSKSPVRVSFGGGGSDLTHFFSETQGAVINATISLYSHATLKVRDDNKIIIESLDLGDSLIADDLETALKMPGKYGLIQAVLKNINPVFGFELLLYSDFPPKSGLGGSAVVASTIYGCFNQTRRDKWNKYEIAELAFQAERFNLGIAGGWQDQYATIFGGINFMEFQSDQNLVHPLRVDQDILLELEENLLLVNTNTIHESGNIHKDQHTEMGNKNVNELVKQNVELTYKMRDQLLRGRLKEFGKSLDTAWEYKRQFSKLISNSHLDSVYNVAKDCGALGGKLLGAGGGGYFLFYVEAPKRLSVVKGLKAIGYSPTVFKFEPEGLRTWCVREN